MAKRKFLLAVGQSNSTAIGDAQSWEDQNLQIALRNPQIAPTQFGEGSYSDTFTLPVTFAGGRQTLRYGTGPKSSPWQTVSTKGLAVQAVKMLTFYDPVPTQTNVLGASFTKYPGTCTVQAGSSVRKLVTNCKWQYDATGLTITRKRDGRSYTVTNSSDSEVSVSPDLSPLPEVGEEFTYPFVGGANGTTSTVLLRSVVGGVNDPGSYTVGVSAQIYATPGYLTNKVPTRFRIGNQPVRVGEAVKVRGATDPGTVVAMPVTGINTTTGTITLTFNLFTVGDCIRVSGAIPGGMSAQQSYWVVTSSGSDIQVSATRGGSVLIPSTAVLALFSLAVPQGIVSSFTEDAFGDYIVAKKCRPISATVTGYSAGTSTLTVQSTGADVFLNSGLADNDRIRFESSTGSFLAGVDYYVRVTLTTSLEQNIQLSRTPYPTFVQVTSASAATNSVLTVQDTETMFYLRRPTTTAVASVAAGATDHITLDEGHFVTIGDKVQFSGASLPSGITANTTYTISGLSSTTNEPTAERRITLQGVTIGSVGSLPITMTQVAGQDLLTAANSYHRAFAERAYQARGSLTGLTITPLTGNNANQTRSCGDVYYDATTGKFVLEVSPAFTNNTVAGDAYSIQPPTVSGQSTPFNKFALWLPWSPFEGEAEGTQPVGTTCACAGAGQPITVTFLTDILAANTQAAIFGSGRAASTNSTVTAGSTASVINCATLVGGPYGPDQVVLFRTGALAGQYRQILTASGTVAQLATPFGSAPATNDVFDIISTSTPLEIVYGRSYFLQPTGTLGTYNLTATYGGTPITGSSAYTASTGFLALQHQKDKRNPYPPGFNYPNHYTPVAGMYQPFQGPSLGIQPKQGHYVGLALRMHEYLGEAMHVIPLGFSGSGLAQRETTALGATGYGWYDPDQQTSWAPGDQNNCFGRLLDVLDAAKTAFALQGDTGECVGIFWAQGEEDATSESRASRYYANCTKLRQVIRQAIVDRGLASVSPHKIPWLASKVRPNVLWTYADTVNAAITKMTDADPYSRAIETSDLPVMFDGIHYTGAGMNTLGQRFYEAWIAVQRMGTSEVDICNLALANIGETAKVTSIDPPDGSAQAALCARFYPLARDTLLEMGSWSFALKRKALVETDNPRSEWEYAYEVPADASGILAVMPPDAADDWVVNGRLIPQKFVVESDIHGNRVLYTNQEEAVIRYNAKIVDTTLFSTLFTIALSWHLSSMLAGPIIKGDVGAAESKRCAQMATAYMMQASSHDKTTQAEIKPSHTPSWISIR